MACKSIINSCNIRNYNKIMQAIFYATGTILIENSRVLSVALNCELLVLLMLNTQEDKKCPSLS